MQLVEQSLKERCRQASNQRPADEANRYADRHPRTAAGHQALSAYIRSRFDEFSRSQKDVAQYIVDHLDEVAFQTAEELARRANTSSSTVVRFSQALGFEGFPELQQAARDEYRRRPTMRQTASQRPRRCSHWITPSSRRRSPPTT